MKRDRVIPIAAILFAAIMVPGDVAGRQSLGKHSGALLDRVIENYQNGELERAWEAYQAFFDDQSNRNVSVDAFGRCFFQQECPALGLLAFILGKSETDAGNFQSFCPDWEHLGIGDLNADQLGASERTMKGFRDGALGGSCAEWATRQSAWFHPRKPGHRLARQVVPLLQPSSWDSRPYSEIDIIATRVNALLDTGATATLLNRRWADQFPDNIEMMRNVRMRFSRHEDTVALGKVDHVRLGEAVFSHPAVIFEYSYWLDSGEKASFELGNIVGMNFLLQYDQVCFNWDGSELYLGDLGPCAIGMTPYRSWLSGDLGIAIDASISSSEYVEVKIDTGATASFCSQWLKERNGEHKTFWFGGDALKGKCIYDPEVLFDDQERGEDSRSYHILLGMDTLSQFAAFGWQLNPLRVYFVPKPPASVSDGS